MSHHLFFEGAPPEVFLPNAGNGLHFTGPVPREGETVHLTHMPSSSNHHLGVWRVSRVVWRWNEHSETTCADVHLLWEPRGELGEKAKLVGLLLEESGLQQVTGAENPWANVKLGAGGLTLEQQATNAETWKHINTVMRLLEQFKALLAERQFSHDRSKLAAPEVQTFTEYTPKLAGSTYGSDEYKGYLKAMKPALDHHYASNRHHPEHFKDGIDDMTLVDLVEMFIDWKAATLRHDDGDLRKSIAFNQERFGYSDQLRRIFENTAPLLEGVVG